LHYPILIYYNLFAQSKSISRAFGARIEVKTFINPNLKGVLPMISYLGGNSSQVIVLIIKTNKKNDKHI